MSLLVVLFVGRPMKTAFSSTSYPSTKCLLYVRSALVHGVTVFIEMYGVFFLKVIKETNERMNECMNE